MPYRSAAQPNRPPNQIGRPHQIGIAGAGALTRIALAPALARMPEARLAAVLDVDPAALQSIAELCPDAVLTTDPERFLAAPLDAVHVATT